MKLIDYLSGDRRGGEARDLELEAQRDPLLAEALQGFEENPGDPAEALAALRRRIRERAALETRRRHRRLICRIAAAAALLIAALTIGLVTLQRTERFETPILAEHTPRPGMTNDSREPNVPQTEHGVTTATERPDSPTPEAGTERPPSRPEASGSPTDTLPARSSDQRRTPADPLQRLPLPEGDLTEFHEDVEPVLTVPVPPEEEVEEDLPFLAAETMPRFQGQDLNGFRKWVQQRIRPSKTVLDNGIRGRVVVTFVIDTTGRLTQIQILQSPDRSLSDEVIRVLKRSPRWEPGRQLDRKVPVKFCIPVDFRPQQHPTRENRNRN